jgi:hypothetical protein
MKRAKVGDVLEIAATDGFAYLQYLGRHPEYGGAVLVRPGLLNSRPPIDATLFERAYVRFYPLSTAVAHGLAKIIGAMPALALPGRFRRRGAIDDNGKVMTWIIQDESGTALRAELTPNERLLPIAAIWNHEMLFHRVTEEWLPEQDN